MAINLHEKYAKEIQTKFVRESLIAGRFNNSYSFSGVKTVNITTPITVPMVDYTRSGANRYGEPQEMQDVVQEMTLTQDKSFSLTIDKGNNADQNGVKAAGKMLSLQIAEQAVPTMDKYCFQKLAEKAGNYGVHDKAPTKSDIVTRISAGTICMDDNEIPSESRTLFVTSETYAKLRLSDEFQKCDPLLEKSLAKGQVGTFDGMAVVKVPKGRWPAKVNFIIVHKSAACAPVKLNDTKLHQDPPGISGNLLEGRQYYDLFVFAAKCDGVYVDVTNADSIPQRLITSLDFDTGAYNGDAGFSYAVAYTTDGSDPRYSKTAKITAGSSGTLAIDADTKVVKLYTYDPAGGFANIVPSYVQEFERE